MIDRQTALELGEMLAAFGEDIYLDRQLAEECVEFAHVVFKEIRQLSHETPASKQEISKAWIEEFGDVLLMSAIVSAFTEQYSPKIARLVEVSVAAKAKRIRERCAEKGKRHGKP